MGHGLLRSDDGLAGGGEVEIDKKVPDLVTGL